MGQAQDTFGRAVLETVWPSVFGAAPTATERQAVQAVSRGEGGYGLASYQRLSIPDGAVLDVVSDSNNWGASHCQGGPPCDPERCFTATDSSPRLRSAENPRGLYDTCFHRFDTPEEGCARYLRILLVDRPGVRAAVRTGSAQQIASAMHASRYFEGFGATVAERIANYATAITRNAEAIAKSLGEPLLVKRTGGLFSGDATTALVVGVAALGAFAWWRA